MVGQSCCAINCKEKVKKGGISFHVFPKDPERQKIWTLNLKREGFIPNDNTRICAKHFEEDCFDREKFGGRWLKSTATPTIFSFPPQLQTKKTSRKTPSKRSLSPAESVTEANSAFPKDPERRKIWILNLNREGFIPKDRSRICAKHFEEDCFDREKFGGTWLKSTATPTIFSFHPQLQTKKNSRKKLKRSLSPAESVTEANSEHHQQLETEVSEVVVLPKKEKYSPLGDFESDCSPTKMKKQLEIAKSVIEKQNRRILNLRRKHKRLMKTVTDLSLMLRVERKELDQ